MGPGRTMAADDGDTTEADHGDEGADEDGDDTVNDLSGLDRDGLLAYAAEHEIDVNHRLGEKKLRAAIREALAG